MKSTIVAIGTMAVTAFAQGLSGIDSLATCGQNCITNMVGMAGQLSCGADDYTCLCLNPDFSYGIRDCTNESCDNADDAATAQAWEVSLCEGYGVAISSSGQALVPSQTGEPESNPSSPTTLVVPGVTSSFTTVISSGTNVLTSTGVTIFPGTTTTIESADTTETSSSTTTETSTETTGTETTPSPSEGPEGTTGSNAPENTDAPDPASRATAPIGILAIAGLVAFLL